MGSHAPDPRRDTPNLLDSRDLAAAKSYLASLPTREGTQAARPKEPGHKDL